MNRIILSVCISAAVALGAGGCSSATSDASDVSGACQDVVAEWTALHDAFEAAAKAKDPDQLAAVKVRDGARKLRPKIETACDGDVATGVADAYQEMIAVIKAIDACAFVEKCGTKVADQIDKMMRDVDRVRSLVEE